MLGEIQVKQSLLGSIRKPNGRYMFTSNGNFTFGRKGL